MEEVAEENLKDLIERNLILIPKFKSNGKPKSCIIHDLVRDLCMREAEKEKFLCVLNRYNPFNPEEAHSQRRLSIHPSVIEDVNSSDDDLESDSSSSDGSKNGIEVLFKVMHSMSCIRSFICTAEFPEGSEFKFGSGLLRVLEFEKNSSQFPEEITELVNLRYLELDHLERIPSSISKLWNLQTLIASDLCENRLPSEFWNMPHLRHLKIGNCRLPRLRARKKNSCVLKSLETLSRILNFRCKDEFLVRVPNLRRLKITYNEHSYHAWDWSYYHLENLVNLSKLESLSCLFDGIQTKTLVLNLAFPISLKKLTLRGCKILWVHMKILGELPNLEILKLQCEAFGGHTWETNEDNFKELKYLLIEKPVDMHEWIVEDSDCFPSLEHLILRECSNLEEIPSVIGVIQTLEKIDLYECSSGVESSAREIQENSDSIKLVIHPRKERRHDGSSSSTSSSSSSSSSS